MPAPRQPLTGEVAREPVTCAPIGESTWQSIATALSCNIAAAKANAAQVKALQGLW